MSLKKKLRRRIRNRLMTVKNIFKTSTLRRPQETCPDIRGKIIIARIIGNDLYPRHKNGQTLKNLKFILENEPSLPGVTKLFIVNRIFDSGQEAKVISLLKDYGCESIVIPFISDEYRQLAWDFTKFGSVDFFGSPEFHAYEQQFQLRMKLWACGPKIRYVMNVNGARNTAIRFGKNRAEWTVVLDGNCIFTKGSLVRLCKDTKAKRFAPYIVVPMDRLESNADYTTREPNPKSREEPQLMFHHSACAEFDEQYIYGLRDKTSLLKALGVPGDWHHWSRPFWMPIEGERMREKYQYRYTRGAVFRLSSGGHGLESTGARHARHYSRNIGILTTIYKLSMLYAARDPDELVVLKSLKEITPKNV